MKYRNSASFGKRQEYIAVAELLKRGHDIYMTLVDDQQIDCVLRKEYKGKPIYLDIQIKARSEDCNPKNAGTFAALEIRKPRKNFYFIFYSERSDTYWIMPSLQLIKEANQAKSGKNKGKYRIMFTNYSAKNDTVTPRPRFDFYRDNFEIISNYKG